jgi:hypothetical protein
MAKGSVTERVLYIPVPASLCMQDVHRGEVAPWVGCGHREGHSQAWHAVRLQGRGLIATFLLRFQSPLSIRLDRVQMRDLQRVIIE